jgi:hypothetical protein
MRKLQQIGNRANELVEENVLSKAPTNVARIRTPKGVPKAARIFAVISRAPAGVPQSPACQLLLRGGAGAYR